MGIPLILALAFVELLPTYRPANSPSAWWWFFVCFGLFPVSVSKPSVLYPGTQPSRYFGEGRVAQ